MEALGKINIQLTQPFSKNSHLYLQTVQPIVFQDEKTLVARCAEWDRVAQNYLYKQFAGKMFTVCLRYSKSREEAEDTLQEGFLKVFDNIKKYRADGSLEGWIRRIMYHAAIEKYRRTKTEAESTIALDALPGDISDEDYSEIESRVNSKELITLIQKLSPRYRMVFNLFAFEGLTHKEIAKELSISEGTSKSNLADARRILQKALGK